MPWGHDTYAERDASPVRIKLAGGYQRKGDEDARKHHHRKRGKHSNQDTDASEKLLAVGDDEAPVVIEGILVAACRVAQGPAMSGHTWKGQQYDKPERCERNPGDG